MFSFFQKTNQDRSETRIWPSLTIAATLEGVSLLCWSSNVNPTLIKGILAITLIADLYALQKIVPFYYETYKSSKDILDFNCKLGIPIVSDLFKQARRRLMSPTEAFCNELADIIASSLKEKKKPDEIAPKSLCRIS